MNTADEKRMKIAEEQLTAILEQLTEQKNNKESILLQPKQYEAYQYIEKGHAKFVFYGGAKGGGKSFMARAKEYTRRKRYAGTTGVVIRKTYPELLANHIRKMFVEYPNTRMWYKSSEKAIYYPNGSITEFKYLQSTDDVYNYQGIEYDDITLDEATQHDEEVFKILKTSLRSDPKVIKRHPDFKARFLLTGNPGGIGHGWVQRIFVNRDFNQDENPEDYHFIQAKIQDNPIFIEANPEYLQNLYDLPEALRRAYLEGDWTVFIGQFFSEFRKDIHCIEPFEIPDEWEKLFSLDWGYSPHPFHCGWYTMNRETNTIYKYRELEGLETAPRDIAEQIVELSKEDKHLYFGVGDTQMWEQNPFQTISEARQEEVVTDKSIALQINDVLNPKLDMLKANKARITGWTNLKTSLQWKGEVRDGEHVIVKKPHYYIFKTCPITLAAYPNQIHANLKPGDMLKQDGDDPCDTDRYALMAFSDNKVPDIMQWDDRRLYEYSQYSQLKHINPRLFPPGAIMPEIVEEEEYW